MSRVRGLGQILRDWFRRTKADAELDEELQDHQARELDRQLRDGVSAGEARRRAALRVGSLAVAREAVWDERPGRLLSELISDTRIGWRGLRRNAGLTAAVVLSLGLGVAGTTTIFSVVEAVLLRPLPYPGSDRLHLVRIWWNDFSASLSPADFIALRDHAQSIAPVGAFTLPDAGFTLLSASGPEVLPGAIVTPELVRVLGVAPSVGGGFSANPDAREVLIGHELWRTRFGGARAVIGRSLTLDDEVFTIVGVMPPGFNVPGQRDGGAWTRLRLRAPTRRGPFYLSVVARVTSAEPGAVARRLTETVREVLRERYGVKPTWRYGLQGLQETLVGDIRTTLVLALTAVGFVLLVAVLNVANLLMARALAQGRELAVRASLGAGRGRLVRQMLAEAALFGMLGGALGLVLAFGALAFGRDAALEFVPRMEGVRIDPLVAALALGTGVAAAILAAVLPVLRLPWARLADSLRQGGRSSGEGPQHGRARRTLVAAEIALALTVLVGAALLMKSLSRLERTDPGFSPAGVLSFRLSLPDTSYDADRIAQFLPALASRLRALPQVSSVSYSSSLPPNLLYLSNDYTVEGATPNAAGPRGVAEWIPVSPDYFTTLGIRVRRGRVFSDSDRREAQPVAIVNDAFVRRHFPGQDPIGKRLKGGDWNPAEPWTTIVGVVADVPYERGIWGGSAPTVYTTYMQNLWVNAPFVVVRTSGDPASVLPSVRASVSDVDPQLPLRDVATMEGRMHRSTLGPRFRGLLASALASIALALATTGIYGVMAYHVNQRRRETAIRRALGAGVGRVVGAVVGSGLQLAAVGVVLGCAGALALMRGLSTLLYQVTPGDPAVLITAAGTLALTAALACAIPALRAARVDPVSILREE